METFGIYRKLVAEQSRWSQPDVRQYHRKNSISISSSTTKRVIRDLLSYTPNENVRAGEYRGYFIYGECVTEVCEAERNWREYKYRAIFVLVWALFVLYEVQLDNKY